MPSPITPPRLGADCGSSPDNQPSLPSKLVCLPWLRSVTQFLRGSRAAWPCPSRCAVGLAKSVSWYRDTSIILGRVCDRNPLWLLVPLPGQMLGAYSNTMHEEHQPRRLQVVNHGDSLQQGFKWDRTNSGCLNGVPNTFMPCLCSGISDPRHTVAIGWAALAMRVRTSHATGFSLHLFHTMVVPWWTRIPAVYHKAFWTKDTGPVLSGKIKM